ncbi:hypothetical protein [Nocardioides sp. GY 10127]|uniref:hypothetical protein n=1 Tax=Nocardioides sp. GY 10127 TaxID=2569762 RepID=UPI0010A9115C|nr:hypothetical protein [Nocardioides sp. GY 10127]TIC78768.1 hypothetical protein E8D37_18910 [Nocardioides sp. GY 10127]
MASTTTDGVPYPELGDPFRPQADLQALADWLQEQGITPGGLANPDTPAGALLGTKADLEDGKLPEEQVPDRLTETALSASNAAAVDDDTSPVSVALAKTTPRMTTPEAFGAVGDGTTDDTDAVQAAWDSGAPVALTRTYRCTESLLVDDGLDLWWANPTATLLKDFAAGSGSTEAFIRNRDFASAMTGVRMHGLGRVQGASLSATGKVFCLYADDLVLEGFTVDTWAGGQAFLLAGDRVSARHLWALNSAATTGCGGIRFVGGDDFKALGCHIESGDDVFQFVPVGLSTDPLYDMTIRRGSYEQCTGVSSAARLAAAVILDPSDIGGMTCSIIDSSFRNIKGRAANRGLVVENDDSTGDIDGIQFDSVSVDLTGATAAAQDILVKRDNATYASVGAVKNVDFKRTRVTNPAGTTATVSVVGSCSDITFEKPDMRAATGATSVIDLASVTTARVLGGRVDATGTTGGGVTVGTGGGANAAADVTVDGTRIVGVPDGGYGVNLNAVAGASVVRTVMSEVSGATTAKAARIGSSSTKSAVVGNDFTAFTTASTGRVNNLSTDAVIRGNLGHNPRGAVTTPTMPATGVAYTNTSGYDCTVTVTGGTVTVIRVGGTITNLTSGTVRVPAGQTIMLTYSAAPTWVWIAD